MWFKQDNFSAGEVSEQILALPDNDVHDRAMRKAQNIIIGKEFKPRKVWGTRFVAGIDVTGNVPAYIAVFEIESFGTVILECTEQALNVYENETLVQSFAAPWLESELKDLWFIQANDRSNLGFFFHGKHMTRTIERRKADTTPFAYEYNFERIQTDNSGPILDKRSKTMSMNLKQGSPSTLEADEAFFNGRDAEASIFRVGEQWCRGTKFDTPKKLEVADFNLSPSTETGLTQNWSGPYEVDRNDAVAVTVTDGGDIGEIITLDAVAGSWQIFDVGDVVDFNFTGSPNTHFAVIIRLVDNTEVKAVLLEAPGTIAPMSVYAGRRFFEIAERDTDNYQLSVNKTQKGDTVKVTSNRPIFDELMLKSGSDPDIDEPATRIHINGGVITITVFESPLVVSGTVASDLREIWPSTTWGQTASRWTGFASAGCFHQNRLIMTGFERFGNRFYTSRTELYRNFRTSANENGALQLGLVNNDANFIRWCISAGDLLIGSRQAEFAIKGVPLVPTNLGSDIQSTYGGSNVQPRQVGTAILFASEDGRELREMVFRFEEDKYVAPNLADHANHLFENSRIKQLAFMREPERIVWVLLDDGTLLGLSYNRDNGVVAWSPMTGRFVESIAVARGTDGDQLVMCVKRTLPGGSVKHYLEIMEQTNEYLDSQITAAPVAGVVSGLGHLEGFEVDVVGDGKWLGKYTVTGGQITIPAAHVTVTSATVGLSYAARVIPQVYDEFIPFDGPTLGKSRIVKQAKIKLHRTFGGQLQDDKGTAELAGLPRFPTGATMDAAVPLFSGWVHHEGIASEGTDPTFELIHSTPHPFEILIVATEVTSGTD